MVSAKSAVIIADTGFSKQALAGAEHVLGVYDLVNRRIIVGNPYVTEEDLNSFAGDPNGHGSIILEATRRLAPDLPVVLIRSHDEQIRSICTSWHDGKPAADGWPEAYLWAVRLCQLHGLCSVANFSFGRVYHAGDGSGWDAFQLNKVTGAGKTGHVAVAAAGPGDGRATHSAFAVASGATTCVEIRQEETTSYNFWSKQAATLPSEEKPEEESFSDNDWILEFWRDGHLIFRQDSAYMGCNFWNQRKQIQFTVEGPGMVTLAVSLKNGAKLTEQSFECWLTGEARFLDHVDETLVVEPAAFPAVIAVGLINGSYSPEQKLPGQKPDVLIPGDGPISFRLPEVVVKVARMLEENADLDSLQVKALLGKYPAL